MPKNVTEEIPGMEGQGVAPVKRIKGLDDAIETWRDFVDKRMALTKKEVESRSKVVELMHKHGLTSYPVTLGDDTEKVLELDTKEKLKLKKNDEDGEEE